MANHRLCGTGDSLLWQRLHTDITKVRLTSGSTKGVMKDHLWQWNILLKNQINFLQRETQKPNPVYCTTYSIPKVFLLCKQIQDSQNVILNISNLSSKSLKVQHHCATGYLNKIFPNISILSFQAKGTKSSQLNNFIFLFRPLWEQ